MEKPLDEIQDEILDRLHAGERIDREAVLAAHPEHVGDLETFFALLDVIEGPSGEEGLAPARLGEFRIRREIGRGGMGIVYEAEQTSLKRRVALKVLPPTLRMDARLVSRFRREAEAAGRLRHPGIVPVYSVGEAAGTPFFAMELVDGKSLEELIRRRRAGEESPLPEDVGERCRFAVDIAVEVAEALAYAHENGILHRDVKPGNVILEADGTPRLTDFGLALDLRAPGLTVAGEVFGSPQYMSPEQAVRREAPIDARTDVYSLAVTLYELLTLRLPYDAGTSAELLTALAAGKVVEPRKSEPGIPAALESVLLRALKKDPRHRYPDAAAFAKDLRAAMEGRKTKGIRAGTARRWKVYAGFALFLAAFWAGFLILGSLRRGPKIVDGGADIEAAPTGLTSGEMAELGLAGRLAAGAREKNVAFWLDLEGVHETLDDDDLRELLGKAFPDRGRRDMILSQRNLAHGTVFGFCRDWNERWSSEEERLRLKGLEVELTNAGPAAAPHVMSLLGENQYDAFYNLDPSKGVTARMQVRALFAVLFLKLHEALPHVILHCRGPSLTCTSTAGQVLQQLTGQDFDAQFLKQASLTKVEWWSKRSGVQGAGLAFLVPQVIGQLRDRLGRMPESSMPALAPRPEGGWWNVTGKQVVADLERVLDTRFPFEETDDLDAQRKQIDRIEEWWNRNRTRLVGGGR